MNFEGRSKPITHFHFAKREPAAQARRDLLRVQHLSRGEVAILPDINNKRVFVIVFNFFCIIPIRYMCSIIPIRYMCSLLAIQKYGTAN